MGLFRALKTNARRALAGSWGRAIGIMLISVIPGVLINLLEYGIREVSGVSEFVNRSGTGNAFRAAANIAPASIAITLLVSLLVFFIMTPLRQGIIRWYYRRTGGERDGVTGIFHYFETAAGYFRALWLNFLIGFRMLLWTLLLTVPLALLTGLLSVAGGAGRATRTFAMLLMLVWMVIACVVIVIVGLRYFLAPYLLAEHPGYKARAAIREGVKLVRGYKGSVFLFALSFILWYLPSLLADARPAGDLLLSGALPERLPRDVRALPHPDGGERRRGRVWGLHPGIQAGDRPLPGSAGLPGARGRTARAAAGRGGNRRFRTGGGSARLTGHKSKEREKHRTQCPVLFSVSQKDYFFSSHTFNAAILRQTTD